MNAEQTPKWFVDLIDAATNDFGEWGKLARRICLLLIFGEPRCQVKTDADYESFVITSIDRETGASRVFEDVNQRFRL